MSTGHLPVGRDGPNGFERWVVCDVCGGNPDRVLEKSTMHCPGCEGDGGWWVIPEQAAQGEQ